jgi:hypothetical protein
MQSRCVALWPIHPSTNTSISYATSTHPRTDCTYTVAAGATTAATTATITVAAAATTTTTTVRAWSSPCAGPVDTTAEGAAAHSAAAPIYTRPASGAPPLVFTPPSSPNNAQAKSFRLPPPSPAPVSHLTNATAHAASTVTPKPAAPPPPPPPPPPLSSAAACKAPRGATRRSAPEAGVGRRRSCCGVERRRSCCGVGPRSVAVADMWRYGRRGAG